MDIALVLLYNLVVSRKIGARSSPPKPLELIPVSTLREAIRVGVVRGEVRGKGGEK